jgi:acyl-CoA thioesterase
VSDLAEALALEQRPGGGWQAMADPRYESISGMFGGWTAAVALGCTLAAADGSKLPSALTVNFIERVPPGTEVLLTATHLGGGRSIDHWSTDVRDGDGRVLATGLVVLSARRETDGRVEPTMPDAPEPDGLDVFHPPGTQGERTEMRVVHGSPPFNRPDTASLGWVRETTGRPVDHLQLAFLADAYAPRSFFWSDGPRVSATMTMAVHFHGTEEEIAAVGDDYVLTEAIGTRGDRSTSGQQARIWSRAGALLVTTEQLCWFR